MLQVDVVVGCAHELRKSLGALLVSTDTDTRRSHSTKQTSTCLVGEPQLAPVGFDTASYRVGKEETVVDSTTVVFGYLQLFGGLGNTTVTFCGGLGGSCWLYLLRKERPISRAVDVVRKGTYPRFLPPHRCSGSHPTLEVATTPI